MRPHVGRSVTSGIPRNRFPVLTDRPTLILRQRARLLDSDVGLSVRTGNTTQYGYVSAGRFQRAVLRTAFPEPQQIRSERVYPAIPTYPNLPG